MSASFAGDTFYVPSSDASTVKVYTALSLKQDTLAHGGARLLAPAPEPPRDRQAS